MALQDIDQFQITYRQLNPIETEPVVEPDATFHTISHSHSLRLPVAEAWTQRWDVSGKPGRIGWKGCRLRMMVKLATFALGSLLIKKYIFSKEEKSNTVTQCWHHILGENVQGRSFLCFCFFLVRYHGAYRASYFNKVLRFNEFITGGHALCHHGKQIRIWPHPKTCGSQLKSCTCKLGEASVGAFLTLW